jgi:putative transposase
MAPNLSPIFYGMPAQRRKFTDEQKLEILQQAEQLGVTAVMRNHNLSYSVLARWKSQLTRNDTTRQELMLQNKARSELKQYAEENVRLKRIIAEQALELERKDEELRKYSSLYGKR